MKKHIFKVVSKKYYLPNYTEYYAAYCKECNWVSSNVTAPASAFLDGLVHMYYPKNKG